MPARVQVRNPVFVADCHPSCPTNSFGQPVILEGASAVPWKQVLLMQLVGYRVFEEVQAMLRCVLLVRCMLRARCAARVRRCVCACVLLCV